MKNLYQSIVLTILTAFFASCAQDIVDVTGTISGIVKDYTTGQVIENCQVALSPTGNTVVTNAEGRYTFKSLQVGTYTLTFTKIGYKDQSTSVEVVSGLTTTRDIQLEAMGSIDFSTSILDFGESNNNMSFAIKNNTASPYEINLVKSAEWLSLSQTRATVAANNQLNITAYVDRSKVGYGTYNTTVTLEYTGSTSGNVVMQVRMVYAKQSAPTVETKAAFDITATTFKIGGMISATGGSVVTAYGHCWSTNPNPTIETAQSTNYGRTTETMSFNSTINQNLVNTVVYVRAYATNAYGTAYGNEVQVTSTSTDPGETGDFAGGTGSAIDPYKLRTPAHMLKMKDFPSANFKMIADIDMDGINWIPFELKGNFDGDNHTLYNLKISPYVTADYQGLFSKVSNQSSVKNLTVHGVEINAPLYSNIGAIAGELEGGGLITNCHVIFTSTSSIIGNEAVGGVIGYHSYPWEAKNGISKCSVSSNIDSYVIRGNSDIGGIAGHIKGLNISNCKSTVNIYAANGYIGGIVGSAGHVYSYMSHISKCVYGGSISAGNGSVAIGGIAGGADEVEECKADTYIDAPNGRKVGGIVGTHGNISGCYSCGEIIGCTYSAGVHGNPSSGEGGVYHCYTLMNLPIIGSSCNDSFTIKDLVNQFSSPINIAEIMRATNSQYASYWNYYNTWTWTGTVNGQTVTAICPKLAWE